MFYKIKRFFLDVFNYQEKKSYDFVLPTQTANEETMPYKDNEQKKIYSSVSKNLEYLKYKYNALINTDIMIREFQITTLNKTVDAFIIFIDGLIDSNIVNDFTLKPLMQGNNFFNSKKSHKKNDLYSQVYNCLLPQNSVKDVSTFEDVILNINKGHCLLFIDTLSTCFNIDAKNYKQRSIETPNNEHVVRGSQESFNEVLRTNTSLIRRIVNNENLIIENINVGKINKTPCAICYINNIANSDLVSEVKYRINSLDIDFLISSGQLEQLIEDNGNISLPQIIATERPDRVSNYLLEGRIAIIVNGSPYILVIPGVFNDFLTSPEDYNLNYQFSNVLKFLRLIAFLFTLLLPGVYVIVTNFHQEILPTEFLFTIISSRAPVPFPIIFEILVMEASFELIREASLRVPSSIGSTIGIIGALILGEAAVNASLVSPVLIIVVALTGISSFAIPDFSLSFHCRIMRFVYIVLGYLAGFLGLAVGLFVHIITLCKMKSFGVPYLEPYLSANSKNFKGMILPPIWKREKRFSFLNTKRQYKQGYISRKWKLPHNKP